MTTESLSTKQHITADRMESLFAPSSIAIVGASDNSGWSQYLFNNLKAGGFRGEVYCINPRRDTVHGQKAYTSLSSLPETVDLAYVLVGTDAVMTVMAEAAEIGVNNLAVVASGFGETGPVGEEKQRQLTEFANQHGQLVFGPNNLGFINASKNVMAFSHMMPWPFTKGGVSLISQSGALAIFALPYFAARDVGLNCLMTMGNEAVINVSHGMEYLIEDPDTRVIALFLESIRDPQEFQRMAKRALELGKPVVACKLGRSERGARSAAAHTGGLVGDDEVVSAALRQLGVIRVDSLEDLIVTAGLLDSYGVLPGNRVGVVTGSGAMAGVVSDIADREGMALADFSAETVDGLTEVLPSFATPQNPLDVTGYTVVDPDLTRKAQDVVLDDPNLDVVVLFSALPASEEAVSPSQDATHKRTAETIRAAQPKVVLVDYLMKDFGAFTRQYRVDVGLPLLLPGAEKGFPALARALWWSEKFRGLTDVDRSGSDLETVAVLDGSDDSSAWSEAKAREVIAAGGVPTVPGELVTSPEEAVVAADRLGYPVVLKGVAANLLHKSDIGAVELDLADADVVHTAYLKVAQAMHTHGVAADGVLVTAMRSGGVEVLVGVIRDPLWGPVLSVGLGGIWVEVLRDTAQRLLPASRLEIRAMLDELQASSLLYGNRGQDAADLDMLTEVIFRIGSVALSLGDRLDTLEVNPLRVAGADVEALDVLVTWRDESS